MSKIAGVANLRVLGIFTPLMYLPPERERETSMGAFGPTEAAIRRVMAHEQVIEIGLRVKDDELAQAIVDLSRTARRELLSVGVTPSFTEEVASTYEMILTQHLMPEIASRLNRNAATRLILSREEVGDGSASELEGPELRRLTGLCWSRSDFARIGVSVRSRFDPEGRNAEKVFATEVIGQDPVNGNLLEIALGRVASPAPEASSPEQDWFAARIGHAARLRGVSLPEPVWCPELRFGYRLYEAPQTDQVDGDPEPV